MERRVDQLNYEPRSQDARRLIFEAEADGCSLIFPRKAVWLIWGDIAFDLGWMTMSVIWLGSVVWLSRRSSMPIPIPTWMILVIAGSACLAALSSLWGLHSHLKRGHLTRCIRVNQSMQILSVRAERSNRWRDWPLAAVREVQLKQCVIPRQKAGDLVIRVQGRWIPLRYRIRNQDVPVAERFVACLNDSRPKS